MYCVIQKVKYKSKEEFKNKNRLKTELANSNRFRGCAKELEVYSTSWTINNITKVKYSYKSGEERFERDRLDAYKISIHHSYRENGKVKKKQWSISTIGYYDVIDYGTYDFIDNYFDRVVDSINEAGFEITYDELHDMVYEKFQPIIDTIECEWEQTEEYRVKKYQDELTHMHRVRENEFRSKYKSDEYEYVYDVFGNLMNEELLNKIKRDYELKKEYERQSEKAYWDRINDDWKKSYSSGGSSYSSLFDKSSTYNEEEKAMLKEIYRMASKKFHPDVCGDDGAKMKFLTKLKEEWGL